MDRKESYMPAGYVTRRSQLPCLLFPFFKRRFRYYLSRDGRQRRLQLHAVVRRDSSRRHCAMDLERERPQYYIRESRVSERHLGFWGSRPGSDFLAYI